MKSSPIGSFGFNQSTRLIWPLSRKWKEAGLEVYDYHMTGLPKFHCKYVHIWIPNTSAFRIYLVYYTLKLALESMRFIFDKEPIVF